MNSSKLTLNKSLLRGGVKKKVVLLGGAHHKVANTQKRNLKLCPVNVVCTVCAGQHTHTNTHIQQLYLELCPVPVVCAVCDGHVPICALPLVVALAAVHSKRTPLKTKTNKLLKSQAIKFSTWGNFLNIEGFSKVLYATFADLVTVILPFIPFRSY